MGYINLWRMNIQQRNSCTSTLISLSDIQPPLVYKSHILNGSINKLYVSEKKHGAWAFIRINTVCTEIRKSIHCIFFFFCSISKCLTGFISGGAQLSRDIQNEPCYTSITLFCLKEIEFK